MRGSHLMMSPGHFPHMALAPLVYQLHMSLCSFKVAAVAAENLQCSKAARMQEAFLSFIYFFIPGKFLLSNPIEQHSAK